MRLVAEQTDAHGDYIYSVAFSPDGRIIVSGSVDGSMGLWGGCTSHCAFPALLTFRSDEKQLSSMCVSLRGMQMRGR